MAACTEDDEISLCSTTWTEYRSDYGAGKDYYVDRVLAEHEESDQSHWYLLQWEGYEEERATWEKDEIVPVDKIQMWQEQKDRVAANIEAPFDLENWDRNVQAILENKERRKQRRAAKRERLGITSKYRPQQVSRLVDAAPTAGTDRTPSLDENLLFATDENHDHGTLATESDPDLIETAETAKRGASTNLLNPRSLEDTPKPKISMNAPTKTATKKQVKSKAIRKPINIFANRWDDRTPRKTPSVISSQGTVPGKSCEAPKARKVLTLSHLNKINKASSNERPPTVGLNELLKVYPSKMPAGLANHGKPSAVVGPASACARKSNITSSSVKEAETATSAPTTAPRGPRSLITSAHSTDANYTALQKTCFFWAQGECKRSRCRYAHRFLAEYSIPPGWSGVAPKGWPGRVDTPVSASVRDPLPSTGSTVETAAEQPAPAAGIRVFLTTSIFEDVELQLWHAHPSIYALLSSTRGLNPHLKVGMTITDRVYEIFKSNDAPESINIHTGDVSVVAKDDGNSEVIHQYHSALRGSAKARAGIAAASVVLYNEWAMLFYFASDAANFGDSELEQPADADDRLRFQIICPLPSPDTPPTVTVTGNNFELTRERFVSYLYRYFAGIHRTDFEAMFRWFDGKMLDKHVFLRFENHEHERDLAVSLIEPLVASITTSDQADTWASFARQVQHSQKHRNRGSGVVIFHPANRHFDQVPDLWRLALSSVNFYMFGPCTDNHFNRYNSHEPIQLWKMWSTGTVTMVSECLLRDHPRRAHKIVDLIIKKAANKLFKDRTWKLFARPQVIVWLREIALEGKAANPSGPWRQWKRLADAINDHLCPEGYFMPGTNDPQPVATLVSGTPEDYAQHSYDCGQSRPGGDEEVELRYFAHWSVQRPFEFRRFCCIVPEITPEHSRLQAKWQHMEILTTERYLDRYGK